MSLLAMRAPWISSLFFSLLLIFSSNRLFGSGREVKNPYSYDPPQHLAPYNYEFPTAKLSTTWTNDDSSILTTSFTDGSRIRTILQEDNGFICGFFCNGACTSYIFAILITYVNINKNPYGINPYNPAVIWSANRDYLVRQGAILNFTAAGELVLQDADGSTVWTTSTSGKSVAGMKVTDSGNLVLFDGHNSIVWQSFDHPTDCLVTGQKLFQGQKLIPSVSPTNWMAQKHLYSLQVTAEGLFAHLESNPPQVYYRYLVNGVNSNKKRSYVQFFNGNLSFFNFSTEPSHPDSVIRIPQGFPLQYMKLMPDGHLKLFKWKRSGWTALADVLTDPDLGECSYPSACGRNAICSGKQLCSCPRSSSHGKEYFRAVHDSQPKMGCFRVTPLTCNSTQHQDFIALKNVKYFNYAVDMEDVDLGTCKQACLNSCSCKAALFEYGVTPSRGNCYLPSDELFTLTKANVDKAIVYIKVQNGRSTPYNISQSHSLPSPKRKTPLSTILSSAIGSFVILIMAVGSCTYKFILQKQKMNSEMEEEFLDQVPGMPTRFSFEELKIATQNFSKMLGEGGFGSVFEGNLEDGSRIAVKCLQTLVDVKKSFLAEVESIGSIHHVNLVRLRGFCAWSSQRLLVYEFMRNGSLDQWIYNGDGKHVLGWECRKKIILDIAKGLAYLHEDCRQKIIHLDIKPQNILLDEDFNAKVSDFGLSKLIDRDQSQVITRMRGTPGYMAPECVGSIITEKVDVYSFGVVLLEILCGRKNFDRSQPQEDWHLLYVFQRCWEEETLSDIVDKSGEDMQVHRTEVMEMMKVASWCLQTDFRKRPSMSSVVKVLDGVMNVESNLDYNFLYPRLQKTTDEGENSSKPMLPSILSGPRISGGEIDLSMIRFEPKLEYFIVVRAPARLI